MTTHCLISPVLSVRRTRTCQDRLDASSNAGSNQKLTLSSLAPPFAFGHRLNMPASQIAATPVPPYWVVIFTSKRTGGDHGYGAMAEKMLALAGQQPGFLGLESVRGADGFGLTISYWRDEESIALWKAHTEHQVAQEGGKKTWYADYSVRVGRVERDYRKRG